MAVRKRGGLMAKISKEFTNLLKSEIERAIRPVFENMSTEELKQFLNGIGPALENDPYIFTRIWNGK